MRPIRSLAGGLAAIPFWMLGACRGADPEPSAPSLEAARAALAESRGFDAPVAGRPWAPGDRVLWSVELEDGELRKSWLVEVRSIAAESEDGPYETLSVTSEILSFTESSPMHPVGIVVVSAGDDTEPRLSAAGVPRRLLQRGLVRFCSTHIEQVEKAKQDPDAPVREYARELGLAMGSLGSLLRLLERIENVQDVLWEVLEKPSLVSVLLNGGVNLRVSFGEAIAELDAACLPAGLHASRAYRVPLTLLLNDRAALACELTVVDPLPPLGLAGGIVRLAGHSPERTERRVVMELIGARFGSEPR